MQFNETFPALPMENFQRSLSTEQLHYPELSGESLRRETFFQVFLEQVTENLGERLPNIQFEKFWTVAKTFFEFSVSYIIF